jgi:hypothetical protein
VSTSFKPLDGEAFILQEQGVFTRICSRVAPVAGGGGARGLSLSRMTAEATVAENSNRSTAAAATAGNGKP